MKISIITLFPEMFIGPFDHSILKNAQEKKLIDINFVNIREFGIGPHKVVDDKPYGGGHGMILRVDVLEKAIEQTKDKNLPIQEQKVILLSPHGKTFNQKKALELTSLKHLILVCGHYEGIDERAKEFIDEELSIGDFIITGGEIPAMLVTDAVTRLIKGVLKEGVTSNDSFSELLEYPQYTKPNNYKNLSVPPVLLSGDHGKIKAWRDKISLKTTVKLRPDLLRSNRNLLGY
ncbi:MAG: tRNA ((1)-)-methyltransferase [Candidatus Levybacteria bacterium]|nr:tRNA ((1)-)-methyltransferase [Candidatus Levybacteria bacterium]